MVSTNLVGEVRRWIGIGSWLLGCTVASSCILGSHTAVSVADDLMLVADGKPRAVIVVADKPSAAAKEAADLLAAQIERISGAKLAIVAENKLPTIKVGGGVVRSSAPEHSAEAFVLIGESQLTRLLGVTTEGLGPGGILMRTFPHVLVLLGSDDKTPADPSGSRNAVTTFLEDVLGFRCLWPGELGLVAPARRTITVPAMEKKYTPPILQRIIRPGGYNERTQIGLDYLGLKKADSLVGGPRRSTRRRVCRTGSNGNGWAAAWASRPAIPSPTRGRSTTRSIRSGSPCSRTARATCRGSGRIARLCRSNLQLIEAVRDKIADVDRPSSHSAVSLSLNDGGPATFCMCPECKKRDPPQGRKIILWDNSSKPSRNFEYVSLTDRMVWFWNQLAARTSGASARSAGRVCVQCL